VALIEHFRVHFFFGIGNGSHGFSLEGQRIAVFADSAVSLSEELVGVIVLVVLFHVIYVDVSLVDHIGIHVVSLEVLGIVGVNVGTWVGLELDGSVACFGCFGQVTLVFQGCHESVQIASASVLWFRTDPVVLADVVLVCFFLDKDHAAVTRELVLDLSGERNFVVVELAVGHIGLREQGLAGGFADHVVVLELDDLFFHGGCRVHAFQVLRHRELLLPEGLLVRLLLDDRHFVFPEVLRGVQSCAQLLLGGAHMRADCVAVELVIVVSEEKHVAVFGLIFHVAVICLAEMLETGVHFCLELSACAF